MWTEVDRGLALEWQAEQDMIHPGCGHPMDECMDEANAGKYRVRHRTCYASEAIAQVADEDREGHASMSGRHYFAVLKGE